MATYLRVIGGVAVEGFTLPAGKAITDCWPADVAAEFVSIAGVTPAPQVGWTYAGTPPVWAAPVVPPPPAATIAQLQEHANAKVNALLTATNPYTAAGVTLKADATGSTIANLLALAQWGTANPTAIENWISNDLTVTPITGAQFVALAPLVGAYAQLLYGTQLAAVLAQIAAGTITTTAQIDAFAWIV